MARFFALHLGRWRFQPDAYALVSWGGAPPLVLARGARKIAEVSGVLTTPAVLDLLDRRLGRAPLLDEYSTARRAVMAEVEAALVEVLGFYNNAEFLASPAPQQLAQQLTTAAPPAVLAEIRRTLYGKGSTGGGVDHGGPPAFVSPFGAIVYDAGPATHAQIVAALGGAGGGAGAGAVQPIAMRPEIAFRLRHKHLAYVVADPPADFLERLAATTRRAQRRAKKNRRARQ